MWTSMTPIALCLFADSTRVAVIVRAAPQNTQASKTSSKSPQKTDAKTPATAVRSAPAAARTPNGTRHLSSAVEVAPSDAERRNAPASARADARPRAQADGEAEGERELRGGTAAMAGRSSARRQESSAPTPSPAANSSLADSDAERGARRTMAAAASNSSSSATLVQSGSTMDALNGAHNEITNETPGGRELSAPEEGGSTAPTSEKRRADRAAIPKSLSVASIASHNGDRERSPAAGLKRQEVEQPLQAEPEPEPEPEPPVAQRYTYYVQLYRVRFAEDRAGTTERGDVRVFDVRIYCTVRMYRHL